jgi:uncharacterized protein YjbI with pentapeptide repeats
MMKHRLVLETATLLALFASAHVARADIFQWEYINPADRTQGEQQITTLCPDGAGANAVAGAYLVTRNLMMGYLIGADLTGADARGARFTNAELSQANLAGADVSFDSAAGAVNLTGASLSQADLTELAPLSTGNSALNDNSLTIPEPSTLLLALLALLGLVCTRFAPHHSRRQTG